MAKPTAYREGQAAYKDGVGSGRNPYPRTSHELWMSWSDGWLDASIAAHPGEHDDKPLMKAAKALLGRRDDAQRDHHRGEQEGDGATT